MNPNIPIEINKLSPIVKVFVDFFRISYSYIQQITKLIGISNVFASTIIAIVIIYYMLNGGILKNWWKIVIIIILMILFSKLGL